MNREVHILSYFTLPTDVASAMQDWPEFTNGSDYAVDLKDPNSGEVVTVRLVVTDEETYVSVSGSGGGTLFDKVLGRTLYELAAHSDSLMVDKWVQTSPHSPLKTHGRHEPCVFSLVHVARSRSDSSVSWIQFIPLLFLTLLFLLPTSHF